MMSISCILIETLYAFENGLDDTSGMGKKAFKSFFRSYNNIFPEIDNRLAEDFYINIRCGLLHQAEPTGGWLIRRDKNASRNKEDKNKKCIEKKDGRVIVQANIFVRKIEMAIQEFCDKILYNDDIALNSMIKLLYIINKHKN